MNKALQHLVTSRMRHSGIGNYIVPGLSSYLVGGEKHGKIRLFDATRGTREFITPHSHRFDFASLVLQGQVINTLYTPNSTGEYWCQSRIDQVCGGDGIRKYSHTRENTPSLWMSVSSTYREGEVYSMAHSEIHGILFSKGALVLFFEGPQVTPTGRMLEPWVNGKCVPTFKTEPWMFEKLDG